MPQWLWILSGWLYLGFTIVMLLAVLMRRRSAQAALGWSLAIVALPVAGSLAFLLFGFRTVPRRLQRKIEHREGYTREALPSAVEPEAGSASHAEPSPLSMASPDRITHLMERLGEGPRRIGNAVALYDAAVDAYAAMAKAVRAATHHVHIEVYIFRNDGVGQKLVALLEEKLAAGVEVRLIVDAVGTLAARRLLRRIRKAGGQAFSFLPLGILGKRVSLNLRNHRKIVVCDGRVAFLGGLNVGEEYLGVAGPTGQGWYDLHMRVEGPAVLDVQRVFAQDWDFGMRQRLEGGAYFPVPVAQADGTPVQIVTGGPDVDAHPIRQALLSAIMAAQSRVWIATPYLVPDRPLMDALRIAAHRGVDVRIVTPKPPGDNRLAAAAGLWHAEELIEAGAQIHHYRHGMMHAKAILIDSNWAMLGSANLDNRSLHLNFELMAIFTADPDLSALAGHLTQLLAASDTLPLQTLRAFGWPRKLFIAAARLLSPIL